MSSQNESYAERISRLQDRVDKLEKERIEQARQTLEHLDLIKELRWKLQEKTSGIRQHSVNCRWEKLKPTECEYRETHHYCPHPEHSCNCNGIPDWKG